MTRITGQALSDRGLEWLEPDGLGGFASGTVSGVRTRRYHGLLCAASTPPTGRTMLVSGLEVEVDLQRGARALTSQLYVPGVVHPDGMDRLVSFESDPCPRWTWAMGSARIELELVAPHGRQLVVLTWRLRNHAGAASLRLRPLLAFRDLHALCGKSVPEIGTAGCADSVCWSASPDLPSVLARFDGTYHPGPLTYRDFLYEQERDRGYDHVEELASPGTFELDLSGGEACLILAAVAPGKSETSRLATCGNSSLELGRCLVKTELDRRHALGTPLDRSADAYLVRRGGGKSIVAGYPWFTDWGRDTLIALRGLCIATGRLDHAREVLAEWAGLVNGGLLPNRFPDEGSAPEYNSIDAALWFAVAVREYLDARESEGTPVTHPERERLLGAVRAIVEGCAQGTRYGIRADEDGLLAAGEPGLQLTWMDARIDGDVITPRVGKPVEVQVLWIHALELAGEREPAFMRLAEKAAESFRERFWNREAGCLFDVVDAEHLPGVSDPTVRCNQIFAVGGLPMTPILSRLLEKDCARAVVDTVEDELWTPLGLRTLAPGNAAYVGRYAGSVFDRDHAYHQGTAWPWLLGAFVEAWVRVRGGSARIKARARERFVAPLLAHLDQAGLGHVSEVVDGDAPHLPGGCPFQAWSLGELLRLERVVLASTAPPIRSLAQAKGPEREGHVLVAPFQTSESLS